MDVDTEEIWETIKKTIDGVQKAIKSVEGVPFDFYSPIRFEFSVVKEKSADGKIKIHIADVGGKYSSQEVSKITFDIGPKGPNSVAFLKQFTKT